MDALWGRASGKRYEHIHVRLALAILGQQHSRKPRPKVLFEISANAISHRDFVGRISRRRNPTDSSWVSRFKDCLSDYAHG